MGSDLLPFHEVAALIATASAVGVLLVTPLYISQRRDLRRLRRWMAEAPDYARADMANSERQLDRAELELERIYADRGEPVPGTGEAPAVTEVHPAGLTPVDRLTSERPALERITMERAALDPHPRWHRFNRLATQPRWMAVVALVAMVVSVGAVIGVQQILDDGSPATSASGTAPGGISVAVLNTTSAGGIGGRVSRQVVESGYLAGGVQTLVRDSDQSVVMYQPAAKRAAKRIAKLLEIAAVQAIDREAQTAVPDADVVVVLGKDRL